MGLSFVLQIFERGKNAVGAGINAERLIKEVLSETYDTRVREDFKAGVRAGVNGTPTFFINGERYDGPRDPESFLQALVSGASPREPESSLI